MSDNANGVLHCQARLNEAVFRWRRDGSMEIGVSAFRAGVLSVAFIGACPWSASGKTLPPHQVTFEPQEATCSVDFLAAATTGTTPPRLQFQVGMLEGLVSLFVVGGSYQEQILLWGDTSVDLSAVRSVRPEEFRAETFWIQLGNISKGDTPFFVTVRDTSGAYSSARYEGLSQDQVSRTLAVACGFRGFEPSAPTVWEASLAEKSLALPDSDIQHIRRILAQRYGEPGASPGEGSTFTVTDRRFILQFNEENDFGPSEYLSAEGAARLLAEEVRLEQPRPATGGDLVSVHRDWAVYSEAGGETCSVMTAAAAATGYSGVEVPMMRFSVARDATGGLMAIELSRPNNFSPNAPINAFIDGQSIALFIEPSSGALVPRPLEDGRLSNEFTLMLQQGREVVIEGTARDTGTALLLGFSALGFTAAFREMAATCGRPAVLGWIQ